VRAPHTIPGIVLALETKARAKNLLRRAAASALFALLVLGASGPAARARGTAAAAGSTAAAKAGSLAAGGDSLPAARPDSLADSLAALRGVPLVHNLATRAATPETTGVVTPGSVPVFLGGTEIFRVRAGRDGLDPLERAAAIRARLAAAVKDVETPAGSVRLVSTKEGVEVRLRHRFLWIITSADVEGMGAAELAALVTDLPSKVSEGIRKERAGRRPLGFLISVLAALGFTLVAWILLRLLLAGSRWWKSQLDARLPRYLRGIRFRNFEVLTRGQLTGIIGGVLARVDVVGGLLLLYAWLTVVLSLFPWTQGWSWLLLDSARSKLVEALIAIAKALPGLFVIVVIVFVFRWLTRLSDRFFDAIAAGTLHLGGFHAALARPSRRLVRILLWIIAVMVAYPYVPGSHSRAVQGVSILIGVMVSLGSTGFVGNVISGIVLTYSRAFSPGERVKIGDHVGDVVSLGFFATKMRTIRNEEVTLPNGYVGSQPIVNYTRLAVEEGLTLHTEVSIGFDVEWRKVHALLAEAAGKVEGIEADPPPRVFQRALNDSNVAYELTCTTRESHAQLALYSRLHEEIQDAFARAGIEILSPAYHAVRDANAPVLPDEPKGPRAKPGRFRVGPDAG